MGRGIALVHAEQVAGEQGGFVAAGPGPDFEDGRGVLVLVLGRQQQGDLALQLRQSEVQGVELVPGEFRHVRITGGKHFLKLGGFIPGPGQGQDRVGHRLQLGMLLGQAHDLGSVCGRAHAGFDLAEAVENLIETGLGQTHSVTTRSNGRPPSTPPRPVCQCREATHRNPGPPTGKTVRL